MRFRLICVLSIVVPLIGWLEMNSSSPFIGTPTTGFSATFAPSYATLALVDLPLDGGGPDANGDATETRTPAEAPTPAETQTPAETPIPTPTPAPEAAVTPTATVTVTATAAVTAPVVSCVQPFPVIPPDRIENERAVADSINAERLRYGLPPLTLVAELSQSARLHSLDMADNNQVSHYGSVGSDPRQRMKSACYGGASWGEIIAWGFSDASSAMGWWMNSPVHRAMILTPGFRDFGVGYTYDPDSSYKYYWTVNFGAPNSIY